MSVFLNYLPACTCHTCALAPAAGLRLLSPCQFKKNPGFCMLTWLWCSCCCWPESPCALLWLACWRWRCGCRCWPACVDVAVVLALLLQAADRRRRVLWDVDIVETARNLLPGAAAGQVSCQTLQPAAGGSAWKCFFQCAMECLALIARVRSLLSIPSCLSPPCSEVEALQACRCRLTCVALHLWLILSSSSPRASPTPHLHLPSCPSCSCVTLFQTQALARIVRPRHCTP